MPEVEFEYLYFCCCRELSCVVCGCHLLVKDPRISPLAVYFVHCVSFSSFCHHFRHRSHHRRCRFQFTFAYLSVLRYEDACRVEIQSAKTINPRHFSPQAFLCLSRNDSRMHASTEATSSRAHPHTDIELNSTQHNSSISYSHSLSNVFVLPQSNRQTNKQQ